MKKDNVVYIHNGILFGYKKRMKSLTTVTIRMDHEDWTWNNTLVPNRKRSTRLYIVTMII